MPLAIFFALYAVGSDPIKNEVQSLNQSSHTEIVNKTGELEIYFADLIIESLQRRHKDVKKKEREMKKEDATRTDATSFPEGGTGDITSMTDEIGDLAVETSLLRA